MLTVRAENWRDEDVLLFKSPDDMTGFCKYNGLRVRKVTVPSDLWLLGFIDNGNTYIMARLDDQYEVNYESEDNC